MFSSCPALAKNLSRSDGRAHSDRAVKGQPRRTSKGTASGRGSYVPAPSEERLPMKQYGSMRWAAALGLLAVSCGASRDPSAANNGETSVKNATLAKLELTSEAFQNGQSIPIEYSCDGANKSPAL